MTNEELEKIRKKYNELIAKRELSKQLKQSLEKLEENKAKLELDLNVQAYVSILEQIAETKKRLPSRKEQDSFTDAGILYTILNQNISEENTNNIYVYIGTYDYSSECDIVHGSSVIQLPDDAMVYGWKKYKNIELNYWNAEKEITKRELSQFESENTILYAPKGIDPEKFYIQIRTAFFEELMKSGQEKALEKVLNLRKK